jgi:hypothetical protein
MEVEEIYVPFPAGVTDFSLLQTFQSGCVSCPHYSSIGKGSSFIGDEDVGA